MFYVPTLAYALVARARACVGRRVDGVRRRCPCHRRAIAATVAGRRPRSPDAACMPPPAPTPRYFDVFRLLFFSLNSFHLRR